MTRPLPTRLIKAATHVGALLPLAILAFDYFSDQLGPNPAQTLEQRTGRIAITLLTATLLVAPLARLFKQPVLLRMRRLLGLYTFLYVSLHLFILVGFDYRFDFPLLAGSYFGKPFIWLGLATGLILAALALTSFDWWKRQLGRWWVCLHRLIYLAAILDLAHFFLAVKGNILSLSGNLTLPLIYSTAILIALILRLPPPNRSAAPHS
ncbi:MAG: protein-methionine-sulfoxide reductase heme-binding subunit MsrQ [Anaerolineaceae bacterium]